MQRPKLSPLNNTDDSDEVVLQAQGQDSSPRSHPPIQNPPMLVTTDDDSDGNRTVVGGGGLAALTHGSGRATPVSLKKTPGGPPPPAVQVETETVPSVPQLAVQTAPSGSGSLRIKKSQDSVPRTVSKAKKRPSRLATTSKAEMFAAKVASAVDKATTSDSDEEFVYDANPAPQETLRRPYLRTRSTSSLPPQSPHFPLARNAALAPPGTANSGPPTLSGGALPMPLGGNSDPNATHASRQSLASQSADQSDSQAGTKLETSSLGTAPDPHPAHGRDFKQRPFVVSRKPGNTVRSERSPMRPTRIDSMRAKNQYLNRWRGTGPLEDDRDDDYDDDDDDETYPVRDPRLMPMTESTPLRRAMSAQYRYLTRQGQTPGLSPHDFGPSAKPPPLYVRLTLWMIIVLMCMLGVSFIVGIFLASSRPLQNLHIARLSDVFPSDKELVFSMVVGAENPGYLSVQVSDAELDVFATSKHLGDKKRTILLGTVTELESPLMFQGTFFQMANHWALTSVKLNDLCGKHKEDICDLWANISSYPFDLDVRGALQYRLLLGNDIKVPVSASVHVSTT